MAKDLMGPDLAQKIASVVRQAGRIILADDENLQIYKKSAANYVTEKDLAVQSFVLARLQELTPDFTFLAEEDSTSSYRPDLPSWILDPVDGTTNLMRDYRHSAVSLALAYQGRIEAAFVYNPYLDELFHAFANQGAFLNNQPIQASRHQLLSDCLIGFGTTPYDRKRAHLTFQLAEEVFLHSLEIRRSGSAALDLAYVACGRLDGFFELQLEPWDYAAGSLLIKEAGGRLSNWHNDFPSLSQTDSILASNGLVHEQLLPKVKKALAGRD